MAYKPSKRAKHGYDLVHTNITPMMNLMVVLIPLLLTSAEFVRLGVIELNLPPAAMGPESNMLSELPQENKKQLDLAVTITDKGFFVSSSLAVLSGKKKGEPTIPLLNNDYDFDLLSQKLFEIKKKAVKKFPDSNQIIIMAEPNVKYQTIISTMDATRSIKDEGKLISLFPDVSLSAGIL
jgi:biopolymer transport protein ExbD